MNLQMDNPPAKYEEDIVEHSFRSEAMNILESSNQDYVGTCNNGTADSIYTLALFA